MWGEFCNVFAPDAEERIQKEKEFDIKAMEVIKEMKNKYPFMTLEDIQTISEFCKMFKHKYIS